MSTHQAREEEEWEKKKQKYSEGKNPAMVSHFVWQWYEFHKAKGIRSMRLNKSWGYREDLFTVPSLRVTLSTASYTSLIF